MTIVGQVQVEKSPVVEIPVTMRGVRFTATVGEERIEADSFNEIAEQIRVKYRRQKIEHAIDVILKVDLETAKELNMAGHYYVRAQLRGKHSRQYGAYLFTVNGKKLTVEHPTIVAMGSRMPDADLRKLNGLADAASCAQSAVTVFIHEHRDKETINAERLILDVEKGLEEKTKLEKIS